MMLNCIITSPKKSLFQDISRLTKTNSCQLPDKNLTCLVNGGLQIRREKISAAGWLIIKMCKKANNPQVFL